MTPVLFFTSRLGGGGAEMHLLRIVNGLDRARFAQSLATARGGGGYESMLNDDIQFHVLNEQQIKSSTLAMMRSVSPLARVIRETKPEVVVSVMGHSSSVAAQAIRRIPSSVRPKLLCVIQNNYSMQRRQTPFPLRLFDRGIRQAYEQADQIIALSDGVAEDLSVSIPGCGKKMKVIPNAAWDDEVIRKSREKIQMDRPTGPLVVACGRLTRQKGFPDLLKAFAKVRSKISAHLWILGKGPDERDLKSLVKSLGLCDSVQFLGFQENPFAFFRAADVFVLSSLWEGFGNVVAEAMACGTAVVATDCPFGPAEILENGKHGLLVPPSDPEALSKALVELLLDEVLRNSFAEKGKKRAEAFETNAIAGRYGDAIEHLLDGSVDDWRLGTPRTASI